MITLRHIDGSIIAECDTDSLVSALKKNSEKLQYINLSDVDLSGINLSDIDLRGADLCRTNLWEANLCGANFQEANLKGTDLEETSLEEAMLDGANLWGADLREANLCGANLKGADLEETNLEGANLEGANFMGTNLQNANLQKANLWGACNILSVGPIGSENRIIYIVNHGDKVMVQAGCFWGTLEKLAVQVKKTHKDSEHAEAYYNAITFIQNHAKIYWHID